MRGCAHLLLITLHRKVLHRELASRDAGDRNRALDDGRDNLAHGAVDRDKDESLERVVGREQRDLRIERDVVGECLEGGRDGVCRYEWG